jgi:hypothetical protein
MPKYKFLCSCGQETEKFTSPKIEEIDCSVCSSKMKRQFPGSGSQQVREVVDSFTNIRQTPDAKAENQARKTEYFWQHEVPRLIQTYSLETCLQEKWLIYDDKGNLVINKPPSKR